MEFGHREERAMAKARKPNTARKPPVPSDSHVAIAEWSPRDDPLRVALAFAAILQDGHERAAEPRQHVLSIERTVCRDERLAAVLAIHAGCSPLGIDSPHEPRPGG